MQKVLGLGQGVKPNYFKPTDFLFYIFLQCKY